MLRHGSIRDSLVNLRKCAKEYYVTNIQRIEECSKSKEGREIHAHAGQLTTRIKPKVFSVLIRKVNMSKINDWDIVKINISTPLNKIWVLNCQRLFHLRYSNYSKC